MFTQHASGLIKHTDQVLPPALSNAEKAELLQTFLYCYQGEDDSCLPALLNLRQLGQNPLEIKTDICKHGLLFVEAYHDTAAVERRAPADSLDLLDSCFLTISKPYIKSVRDTRNQNQNFLIPPTFPLD